VLKNLLFNIQRFWIISLALSLIASATELDTTTIESSAESLELLKQRVSEKKVKAEYLKNELSVEDRDLLKLARDYNAGRKTPEAIQAFTKALDPKVSSPIKLALANRLVIDDDLVPVFVAATDVQVAWDLQALAILKLGGIIENQVAQEHLISLLESNQVSAEAKQLAAQSLSRSSNQRAILALYQYVHSSPENFSFWDSYLRNYNADTFAAIERLIQKANARDANQGDVDHREGPTDHVPLVVSRVSEPEQVNKELEEVTMHEPAIEETDEEVVAEPTEEPAEKSSNWWLWLIGAVIVVGGLGLALRRKS